MFKTDQAFDGMRRNLSRLASGAVFSQALMVASTPLLTRVFSPEAFGIMAVFSATYAIAIPISTLKFDAAVILPKAGHGAIGLTALVILISSSLALVASGLGWLAAQLWLLPQAHATNVWLPLALWLGALYTLTQQWSARISDYKHFARSQVLGAALNIGTSLALGLLFGGQPAHLVMGFVCGLAGSLGYMYLSHSWKFSNTSRLSAISLLRRAKVYRQFPLLVLPTTLLMTIGQNSIPLVLNFYYSIDDVGQFAIANRLLLVPAALIGGALTEAFRSEFVRRQRNRLDVAGLFRRTLGTLTILAIPMFAILAITAHWLFSLVFGTDYEVAGHIARSMILGVAAQFVGGPFASIFVALRRAAIGFSIQIVTTVVPLAMLAGAAAFHLPLTTALAAYAAASAATIAAMLFIALRHCQASDRMNKSSSST